MLSILQGARFFSKTEITIENSYFKVQASITARLEASSGFRYYSFDIKLPTFCGSNALLNDGGLLREGIEKKRRLRRSGDDYDHELLGR